MSDGKKLISSMERANLSALVMGPGLGLDTEAEQQQFREALGWAKKKNLAIVLDGPVLRLLAKVIRGGESGGGLAGERGRGEVQGRVGVGVETIVQ